jgi:hypothetical protein
MQIDLSGLEQQLLGIAALALTTVATIAIHAIAQAVTRRFNLQADSEELQQLDSAAQKGIAFGVMQAQERIKLKGWDHAEVQNAIAGQAVAYLAEKFPETLAKAGLDPSTDAGRQAIKDLVTRALPAGVAAAAASPTTPPTTQGVSS